MTSKNKKPYVFEIGEGTMRKPGSKPAFIVPSRWIRIKGGNGEKVVAGETRDRQSRCLDTIQEMITAVQSNNFRVLDSQGRERTGPGFRKIIRERSKGGQP